MRFAIVAGLLCATSLPAQANQTKEDLCRVQADLVVTAFNARIDGETKRKVRRDLRQAINRDFGDMLAEVIFSTPEESLTEGNIKATADSYFDVCKAQ